MTIRDCLTCCFENFFKEPVPDRKKYSPIPAPLPPAPESPNCPLEFSLTPLPDEELPQDPLRLHSGYFSPPGSPKKADH